MEANTEMEQQLWEYIDGIATPAERAVTEQLIATDDTWKATYEKLLVLHQSLADIELDEPSFRFTKNVMEAIAGAQIAPATRNYLNRRIVWGIAFFFILSILSILVYAVSTMEPEQTAGGENLNKWIDRLDFSSWINSTLVQGFILANVVLALVLLDGWLNKKKKEFSAER